MPTRHNYTRLGLQAFCASPLPFRPEFRGGFFMQCAWKALSTTDLSEQGIMSVIFFTKSVVFFPKPLIFFIIRVEKVCYKLCNAYYKLCNTCYKLTNTCYKVCNKNYPIWKEIRSSRKEKLSAWKEKLSRRCSRRPGEIDMGNVTRQPVIRDGLWGQPIHSQQCNI